MRPTDKDSGGAAQEPGVQQPAEGGRDEVDDQLAHQADGGDADPAADPA